MKVTVRYSGHNHEISATDSQRAKLYRAEWDTPWPKVLLSNSQEEILDFAKKILSSACFRRLLAQWNGPKHLAKVAVSFGHASRKSSTAYDGAAIVFAPRVTRHACAAWHVCHEVAHIACPTKVAHHWPFAAAYLELVRRFLGAQAARDLKASFRRHGVKWKPRKKRVMTEEQREAVAVRMAAMRAARGRSEEAS